jgi:rhomboid protease GluP
LDFRPDAVVFLLFMADNEQPELQQARIAVRSRRQAMDWSLVLASQGIEATIHNDGEANAWELLVPSGQSQAALKSLKQYHLENRTWGWHQDVFKSGFVFDYSGLVWVVLAVCFYGLDAALDLHGRGLMNSAAVAHGQWWRLFTATWLHADLGHLVMNLTIGVILLGLAMGSYGTARALAAAYLAGAGGNLFAGVASTGIHQNLGSSGMVMGCLGLLAAHSVALWRKSPLASRYIISGFLGGTMLFVLLGLNPDSDILAHLGGFIFGLIFGIFLSLFQPSTKKIEAVTGTLYVLLIIVPWWFALQHQQGKW